MSIHIRTPISIIYIPWMVRIFKESLLFCDCSGCSHELCRGSRSPCISKPPSMACNLSHTSQITWSCNSFTVLSHSHCCQSPFLGDCCCLSVESWCWSATSAFMSLLLSGNCDGLPLWSRSRCAMLLLRCFSFSVTQYSSSYTWNKRLIDESFWQLLSNSCETTSRIYASNNCHIVDVIIMIWSAHRKIYRNIKKTTRPSSHNRVR